MCTHPEDAVKGLLPAPALPRHSSGSCSGAGCKCNAAADFVAVVVVFSIIRYIRRVGQMCPERLVQVASQPLDLIQVVPGAAGSRLSSPRLRLSAALLTDDKYI